MSRARFLVFVLVLAAVIVVVRTTGLTNYLGPDNLARLRDYVEGFGPAAPLVFVVAYVVATVAFLTGTPLTLLAGLAFGPVMGAVYVVAGATVGLTLAFLVARYAARSLVASCGSRRTSGWDASTPRSGGRAGGYYSSPASSRYSRSTSRTTPTG